MVMHSRRVREEAATELVVLARYLQPTEGLRRTGIAPSEPGTGTVGPTADTEPLVATTGPASATSPVVLRETGEEAAAMDVANTADAPPDGLAEELRQMKTLLVSGPVRRRPSRPRLRSTIPIPTRLAATS